MNLFMFQKNVVGEEENEILETNTRIEEGHKELGEDKRYDIKRKWSR